MDDNEEEEDVVLLFQEEPSLPPLWRHRNDWMTCSWRVLWTGQNVRLSSRGKAVGWFTKDGTTLSLSDGEREDLLICNVERKDAGLYHFKGGHSAFSSCHVSVIECPSDGGSGVCLVPVRCGDVSEVELPKRTWRMIRGHKLRLLAMISDKHTHPDNWQDSKFQWHVDVMQHPTGKECLITSDDSCQPGLKHCTCEVHVSSNKRLQLASEELTVSVLEPSTVQSGVVFLKMNLAAARGVIFGWLPSKKWPVHRQGVVLGGRMEFVCACQDDEIMHEWYFKGEPIQHSSKTSYFILERVEQSDQGEYFCKHPGVLEQHPNLVEQESQHCFVAVLELTMKQSTWDVYMKQLEEGSTIVHEQRIILCGPGRAGKSSVKRSLFGEEFNPGLDSTVGMELSRAWCTAESTDKGWNWSKVEDEEEHRDMLLASVMSHCSAGELDDDALQPHLQESSVYSYSSGVGEQEDDVEKKCSSNGKLYVEDGNLTTLSTGQEVNTGGAADEGEQEVCSNSEDFQDSGVQSDFNASEEYHGVAESKSSSCGKLEQEKDDLAEAQIAQGEVGKGESDEGQVETSPQLADHGAFGKIGKSPLCRSDIEGNHQIQPQPVETPPRVVLEEKKQFNGTARSAIKAAKRQISNIRKNVRMVQRAASNKWSFITMWDFAGQKAFAVVQHLLMSHMRTAYAVAYNAKWPLDDIASEKFGKDGKEIDAELENIAKERNFDVFAGWLDVLHHVFSKATNKDYTPLLYVICTHADGMSEEEKKALRLKILKRIEGKPYEGDVRDIVFVDNTLSGTEGPEDPTIVMLRKEFITAMQSDSSMQSLIPLKWLPFIASMRKLAAEEGCPVVPLSQAEELAKASCETQDANEIDSLLSFCHCLGHLLYFTDNEQLRQKVVINVEWLVKVVSLLFVPISVYQKLPSNHRFIGEYRLLYRRGILLETLAVHIWCQNLPLEYVKHLETPAQRSYLFGLMEEYGLLVRASDSTVIPGDKSVCKYWVPAMVGLEKAEDEEEEAAFSCMEKDSQKAPVQRSLPIYLHCSDGHQFPRSVFWRLVTRCMQHYREVGDAEGALPILHRSSVRLLCDSDHWLLLRRYQCGLQVIIEQEDSQTEDQQLLSSVCQRVRSLIENELTLLTRTSFDKFTWCLSARCRCPLDSMPCKDHQRARCPFVDCQHFVPLDKPRCRRQNHMQPKQDVSAVRRLWRSKKVSGRKPSTAEPVALQAAIFREALTHHLQLFQERISAKQFVRPFYEEMLLSVNILRAINCSDCPSDANRRLLEAVILSDDYRMLAMFVSLLAQHGFVALVQTLLTCPGKTCGIDAGSFHGSSLDASSPTTPLQSQPQLEWGAVLNEADSQLFDLAHKLAFNPFDLKEFAQLLLENSGCRHSGSVFLAGLDIHEYTTVPHRTHAVLKYWISGASGPSYKRFGGQLAAILEKMNKKNVIRDFNVYLNFGSSTATSPKTDELQAATTGRFSADSQSVALILIFLLLLTFSLPLSPCFYLANPW